MPTAAGIDLRLGVEGQDPVTGAERLALIAALVQVHDDLGPGLEVRVARDHPRLVLPWPDRVLGQDPRIDDADMELASPRAVSSAVRRKRRLASPSGG